MKVVSFTGVVEKNDIQIQKACAKLQVKISKKDFTTPFLYDSYRDFLDLKKGRCTIAVVNNNADDVICMQVPLYMLFEFAQWHEGLIREEMVGDVVNFNAGNPYTASNKISSFEITGHIDLTGAGNVYLANNGYLKVDFHDLDPSWTVEVNTVEMATYAPTFYHYNNQFQSADVTQRGIENKEGIMFIAQHAQLKELRCSFANGSTCNYTKEELINIMFDTNDVVRVRKALILPNETFHGTDKLLIEEIATCDKMDILTEPSLTAQYWIVEARRNYEEPKVATK